MSNKLKLFYISMIVMLMIGVAFAIDHIEQVEATQEETVAIQNQAATKYNKLYLETRGEMTDLKIECNELELKNKRLEHDIQEVIKEYHVLTELLKNKALTIE